MEPEKVILIKVLSFTKKKKRPVTDAELDAFERLLSARSKDLCQSIKASETLTAEDYGTRVYA